METLSAFLICLLAITLATAYFRIPPFPALFGSALLFGWLAGLPSDIIVDAAGAGAGRIFAILGVAVFGGSVIAASLSAGNSIPRILADINALSRRPALHAGLSGWLLAVPFMCAITPFLVLAPLFKSYTDNSVAVGRLFSLVAAGSVLSFVLIAPAPVMAALMQTFGAEPALNLITIPLSLLLLAGIIALLSPATRMDTDNTEVLMSSRWAAWAPIAIPVLIITAGFLIPGIGLLGTLPVALLAGALVAVLGIPATARRKTVTEGTKHAGVIIFDLCGAGAFGAVIAASTFPADVSGILLSAVPVVCIPFILAALIQTAQGSRVVTAVIAADIIAETAIPDLIPAAPLLLMIAGGTMVISYVSDPFFWLVNRTSGGSIRETVLTFTLPLAAAGCLVFGVALLLI